MPRRSAYGAIEARKRNEAVLGEFHAIQTRDAHLRAVAQREERTGKVMVEKEFYRHLDRVQAQQTESLVARRKRLAELLAREKEEHDSMLNELAETPEQRRERLIRKARALKEHQDDEQQQDCQQRNDRLFREKIDSLRQAESRLKVLQVADARFHQLELADKIKRTEEEEELFFKQQDVEAQRLMNERAQKDLEVKYLRDERLRSDLAAQLEGNAVRKAAELEVQRKDDEEFRRQVYEEATAEAAKKLDRRRRQEALAEEMKQLNEELQRAKKFEYEQLRKEDREALDVILAEIAADAQREREEKAERKRATFAHMKDLETQRAQRKDDDDALDKMWEEANNKQWEKREARWRADQEKRDRLMRNILIVRRQQVLDKHQHDADAREEKKREHEEFLTVLNTNKGNEEAEKERRRQRLRDTQQYLNGQIQERQTQKDAALREKRTELTDQEALEELHKERIAREMQQLENAKPERYKHVPLLPPKQRNQPL